MKIFFDGGCRPNPGAMESAVVARGRLYHQPSLGHGSSEQAEWLALLHAVEVARQSGEADVTLLGDCASVIRRANGVARCRSLELQPLLARFRSEARHFTRLRLRHVRRTQNLAGIALDKIRERSRSCSESSIHLR